MSGGSPCHQDRGVNFNGKIEGRGSEERGEGGGRGRGGEGGGESEWIVLMWVVFI